MAKISSYVANHKQFIIDSFSGSKPYCAVVQALAQGKDNYQIGIYVMDGQQEIGRLKSINSRQGPIKDIELDFTDKQVDFALQAQRRTLEKILENPLGVKDKLDHGFTGAMNIFYKYKFSFLPGRLTDYKTFARVLPAIPRIFQAIDFGVI